MSNNIVLKGIYYDWNTIASAKTVFVIFIHIYGAAKGKNTHITDLQNSNF